LAQELSRERPTMKVVYISGYTGRAFGAQGPIEPGSFFLMKPFTRDDLTQKIREALESRVLSESR